MPFNDIQLLITISAVIGILIISTIWIIAKLIKLDRVRKEFFSSSTDKNLEQVLVEQNRSIVKINQMLDKHNAQITDLSILNKDNVKKIGFVRFNHIDGSGGNLSFTLALLNEHDDGMVISSHHGRTGARLYAKQIKKAASESKLTEEETQAVTNAQ